MSQKETLTTFDFVVFANSFYITIVNLTGIDIKERMWHRGGKFRMPFHNLKYTDIHMFSRIRARELCMTPGAGGTTLSFPTLTSGVRTQFICGDTFYVSDVSRSGRWGTEAASHNNTTRQPPPGKKTKC